jgi:2-C-methyl-D-erythritol 2,4-cyclodiphosphate synthase
MSSSAPPDATELRIGIGHDTHRLVPGGPLRLGGIEMAFDQRLEGHSDADVLLHAVIDALLGAAGMGDIGEMFPDTDPAHKGRDSAEMLAAANARLGQAGWEIVNLDCIIFAEKPKITPYKGLLRARLAQVLAIDADQVGIKAKTGEAVGLVGRGEAIVTQCVALLQRRRCT